MQELSNWEAFNALRSSQEKAWKQRMPKGLTTRINVFKARFDIAARIKSMSFSPEFNDDTNLAYLAGTRLLLAYSAAEAYMRAEDLFRSRKSQSVTTWSISRGSLASELRPLVQLILNQAQNHGTLHKNTQKYLVEFSENNKSDVRPVATALRHVHAHGGLTARSLTGGTDSQADGYVKPVNDLAQALLDKCDEKFIGLFEAISAKINQKSK